MYRFGFINASRKKNDVKHKHYTQSKRKQNGIIGTIHRNINVKSGSQFLDELAWLPAENNFVQPRTSGYFYSDFIWE
jgi:hypothetical protein